MTIAIRGTVQTATGTPVAHSAITGITNGDLYIDYLQNFGAGPACATDAVSAFTAIATASVPPYDGLVAYRVRTGAEGALSASGGIVLGNIFFALSGASGVIESVQSGGAGYGATHTIPASTPTEDNCWHLLFFSNDSDTNNTFTTAPSGYTSLGTIFIAGQGRIHAFYKDLGAGSSGVSTGSQAGVWSGACTGLYFGFIVKPAATIPTISIGDVTVDRIDGTATVPVTLSSPAPVGGVTVNYATQDDTATAPAYYTAASGTLTFAEGETTKNVTVNITA